MKKEIADHNNIGTDLELVVLNNINSNKKSVSSYPAFLHPKPFIFSKPRNIKLYRINNFCMGIIK